MDIRLILAQVKRKIEAERTKHGTSPPQALALERWCSDIYPPPPSIIVAHRARDRVGPVRQVEGAHAVR
jgi:hypothetical protein